MSDYEKLRMTAGKTEGEFVRTLQGRTGTGFQKGSHVHKDWWAKTLSYDEGLEQLQLEAQSREDILTEVKNVTPTVNDEGQFVFKVDDRHFLPTEWALGQFSTRCGLPSSTVLRNLRTSTDGKHGFNRDTRDAETMVAVASNSMRRLDQDKKFRLRTYQDGTLRAFVTEKYAPIDNRWYMEVIKETLPDGRLSHWKGNADTIFGNILLPDTIIDYGQDDDTDYGGMLSIGNCEIGKRRISQMPSLFRAICMNGCIWSQTKGSAISKKHMGEIDLHELKLQINDNIQAQLPLLPQGIERLLGIRAMGTDGVSMKPVIAQVCSENKFDKRQATEVLAQWVEHESSDRNLFGVVNAITRAGQEFDNQSWVKFDEIGGRLIDTKQDRWSSLVKRAGTLNDKDIQRVFLGSAA